MIDITLTANKETECLTVSNLHLRKLNELKDIDNRFELSIVNNASTKGKTEKDKILNFLYRIYTNKRLIKSYFY